MEGDDPTKTVSQSEAVEPKDVTGDKTDTTGTDDVKITISDKIEKEVDGDLGGTLPIDNKEREDENQTGDNKDKIEEQDRDDDEKKDVEKPLIDENETVTIDLGREDEKFPGEDAPTLPLPDKKKPLPKEDDKEEPPSMFLHPIDTLRHAWRNSKSMPEFFMRAICIVFASVGWLFCVGGVPFLPLAMLIIGSIFVHDCPVQPNIPVYLIVAGLFGLIQHVTALMTKYLPKDSRSLFEAQRRRCLCLDSILQTFLFIWFIAGCVWVYGIYEPEYKEKTDPFYCHKTVYLFTFWMFNVSFIILCSIIAFAFCVILCIVTKAP